MGFGSHWTYFIRGERHRQAFSLAILLFTLISLQGVGLNSDDEVLRRLTLASIVASFSFLLCLFTSIIIYRICFHRLRSFPGPALAKVSKFWHLAHLTDSKNYLLLDDLRKRYGEFVRTGRIDSRRLELYAEHGQGQMN
jgi:hypothetical protein